MNSFFKTQILVPLTLLSVGLPSFLYGQQPPPPRPTPPPPPSAERSSGQNFIALSRGPVHEAFAQPNRTSRSAAIVVDQQPPAPIDELPPRQVPQMEEIQWIPGYWGWDPAEYEFVWVSGVWRRPPQDMVWLPGDWVSHDGGYAWISGAWVEEGNLTLITKTPPEPRHEEAGQAPSDRHFWVPGSWVYQSNDYRWEPGFWAEGEPNQVWIPQRYVWMPRGYLLVNGYWDYPLEQRGILFSPVRIETAQRQVRYTPSVVVSVRTLPTHLFVYNDYGHYHFGNYYDVRPKRGQLTAWVGLQRNYYDPLFVFYSTVQRDRFDYYRTRHDYFIQNANARPAVVWNDRRPRNSNADVQPLLAASVTQLVNDIDTSVKMQFREDDSRWQQFSDRRQRYQQIEKQRREAFKDGSNTNASANASANTTGNRSLNFGPLSVNVDPENQPQAKQADAPKPEGQKDRGTDRPGNSPDRQPQKPDQPNVTDPASPQPETPKPETPKPETPKPETPKPETPKPETPKPETPKPETPKPETPKPESPKPETPKPETPKPESPKPESPKPESPKPESPKPESPKPESPKPESPKPESPKPEAPKPEAGQGDAGPRDPQRGSNGERGNRGGNPERGSRGNPGRG